MTKRQYAALVLPWGEKASQFHPEHPRRSYEWGDVHLPRKDLKLTDGHDGPVVGLVTRFAITRDGITATIKLGDRGQELLEQGYVGLSAEIDEDTGDLIGVAIATEGEPAFRSARILVEEGAFMAVATAPRRIASGPAIARSVTDLGAARRELAAYGMAAVDVEVDRARRAWDERQLVLAEADRVEEEERLVASGVPKQLWPSHTSGRQSWEAASVVQRAEAVRDEGTVAALAFTRRMARLEGDAERERLPWYRRLVR